MLIKSLAAIGGAAVMAASILSPAAAQDAPPTQQILRDGASPDDVLNTSPSTRGNASRLPNPPANRRNQPPPPPTAEENMAAAQQIASAAGVACQVTQANLIGLTAEQASTYEAACATGPGYILISSAPPQAIDCVLLAGQADIERARDPAAVVGTQCVMPQNTDIVRVVSAYATEAGIPCRVDQGASIGRSTANNLIYEVGCADADGFWIEKVAAGWEKTECSVVITQNAACRFSTVAEQAASLKTRLVGSEAAPCDVTQSRYMGANANGSFYEAKCGDGKGMIVRFDTAFAVQQVYPCETAHRIGGGCTLTIVPPAPAATEQ